MKENSITVDNREIKLSNTDKIFYPAIQLTKGDVINYYQKIAKIMLPHLKDRPISMQRFPNGVEEPGFYEKEEPNYFPDWIDTVNIEVKESGDKQKQILINKQATLVYLANQACLIPHIWLSQKDHLNQPDKMIFDLDPPDQGDFSLVRITAQEIKSFFENINIKSYVMTTGSRGLHIIVPLNHKDNFEDVRDVARKIAGKIASKKPEQLTTEISKNKRDGRIFIDYLRNAYGQTSVPPYSLRALPNAPVATPLHWDEIQNNDLTAQSYRISNIFRRLGQIQDPFKDFFSDMYSLKDIEKNSLIKNHWVKTANDSR